MTAPQAPLNPAPPYPVPKMAPLRKKHDAKDTETGNIMLPTSVLIYTPQRNKSTSYRIHPPLKNNNFFDGDEPADVKIISLTIIYRQIILTHMNDNRDPDIIMSHENFKKKNQKNHKIDKKTILNKKITKF